MFTNWIVDFDDTLAIGPTTYALETAIPRLMRKHQLPHEPEQLRNAIIKAEQTSNLEDHAAALSSLFVQMGWELDLRHELFHDIMTTFQPILYEDSIPFLEGLKAQSAQIFVLSNNNRVPSFAKHLAIEHYFKRIITPKVIPNGLSKPHTSMWDFLAAHEAGINENNTIIIGDDPWSDGAFAKACGLSCVLLDRKARYTHLPEAKDFHFVPNLAAIPLDNHFDLRNPFCRVD